MEQVLLRSLSLGRPQERPAAAALAGAATLAALATANACLTSNPRQAAKPLRVVSVFPAPGSAAAGVTVLLLHGMWHGAWFFAALQNMLAAKGITSHAVALQGDAADMNRTEADLVGDLEATLDELKLQNVAAHSVPT
jgi:hypothetical protein